MVDDYRRLRTMLGRVIFHTGMRPSYEVSNSALVCGLSTVARPVGHILGNAQDTHTDSFDAVGGGNLHYKISLFTRLVRLAYLFYAEPNYGYGGIGWTV